MPFRNAAFLHLRAQRTGVARARGVRVLPRQASPVPVWAGPTGTYIICTNPRSGSWFLSEGLAATSVAGNPREWFNVLEEQQYRARWRMDHASDLSQAAYLRMAKEDSTTSNGISGVKLHYYQLAELRAKLAAMEKIPGLTFAKLVSTVFPKAKYLWLRRRDKARQAISLHIAYSTNKWWTIADAAQDKGDDATGEPEFDPHAIAEMESLLLESDSKWRALFDAARIEPFILEYEDLASDYTGAIRSVLKWLGVPNPDAVEVPVSRLKRQSDARSEEWLTGYLAFKNQRGDLAGAPASVNAAASLLEGAGKLAERPLDRIPVVWKRWIAQSKLRKNRDNEIVEVLVNNGYSRASAVAEVGHAASDPYLQGAALTQRRLNKGASLLNAMGQVARLGSHSSTIERRTNLSREEFRDRYYAANRPVIIQNLMTGWRAMTAWTPDYLKRVAGDRMIEVMTGREADPQYEMNGRKHRTELRFSDYIDKVYSGKVTNDYYMVANNAFFQKPETAPLLQDFTAFPEYLKPATGGRQCFLWFGPAGTITPLHHDTSNILMAQVAGRKRYRLIPASQWQYVYNSSGVFSDVDCEKPDLDRHPKFRHATIIDTILEPGEALFMPVGWWHQVRALEVSMTVSFTNFVFPNHFVWEESS